MTTLQMILHSVNFVNFQNTKNTRHTFCEEIYSGAPAVTFVTMTSS